MPNHFYVFQDCVPGYRHVFRDEQQFLSWYAFTHDRSVASVEQEWKDHSYSENGEFYAVLTDAEGDDWSHDPSKDASEDWNGADDGYHINHLEE